ncbi:uro-adherence factor A isoform X2 [Anabrus simplex]|uniref:uro-adherence factor A isoform X2 n=1 Tax=Anabrus simplex TaxID=316456 RepID=UPI0035A2BC67
MDSSKKKTPDYTDIAYREAVARLRYLLAESYSPQATPTKIPHVHMMKPDDSGDETDASGVLSERSRQVSYRVPYFSSKRTLYSDSLPRLTHGGSTLNVPAAPEMGDGVKSDSQQPPPELMAFIERQEEYIEQLEKESQYCREELSNLLGKVKEVISENEGLHEKEKSGLLKSVFDCFESEEDDQDGEHDKTDKRKLQPTKKKRLEGPSIVFESRISELEAQLTQTRIDLRKALEEAETCKKKLADGHPSSDSSLGHVDSYRQQIETLQREKDELSEKLSKMNSAVNQIRDKESDSSQKVKRSLDLVDQAQFEKAQAELEVRRLKDELDRQHDKLRDLLQEQGRRVQEERVQAERRYAQQIEQLSADLTTQWDSASKLQLELEKQRRTESELRRELQQKNITIEELKKELQTKIERGSLEQELAASRLMAERAERELRQESSRLQAEVTALRQRLDRADSDLLHSRRENLRLSEQVASLEREVNLAKMMKESSDKGLSDSAPSTSSPVKQTREKELTSMIMDMEAKHVSTVAELESMIQSQNQLMEKLKDECRTLTQKLEDSSARHKEEKSTLREENAVLLGKLEKIWTNYKELEKECIEFGVYSREQSGGIMEVQTTPMLKSATQEPSMAFKHSMSHSRSLNHSKNTNHSYSMSRNQNMNPSHSQDTNPSQIISHSQDTNPSQIISHSQDTNPNQTMTPNHSLTPSKNMNRSQNSSHNKDMSPSHNFSLKVMSPNQNFSHKDMSPSQNFNLKVMSPNQNCSRNKIMNLSQNTSPCPTSMNLNKTMKPSQDICQRQNTYLSQTSSPSQNMTLSQTLDHRLDSDLLQEWSPKPTLAISSSSQAMNPLRDSGVSQVGSFIRTLGLSQIENPSPGLEISPVSSLSQARTHIPALGPNQVWNHNLVSGPNQVLSLSPASGLNQDQSLRLGPSPIQNLSHSISSNRVPIHHQPLGPNPVSSHNLVLDPSLSQDRNQARPSLDHPPLSPRRREVDRPPLTLEDLATDSDSHDSQSAQLRIFR